MLYRSTVEDLASDAVADSFLKRALERGYKTMISVGGLEKNNDLLDNDIIGTHGITAVGVIAGSSFISDSALKTASKQGIHIVLMGRHIESKLISQALEDNYAGVEQAANYIYSQGANNVWIICPPKKTVNYVRSGIEAFMDCAKKLGKPEPIFIYVPCMPTSHSTAMMSYEIFNKELDKKGPPDAVFGTNDTLIYPVMRVLNEKGYTVGKEVSVVGYGDLWPSEVMMTALTTVRLPFKETGSVAADILIDLSENKIKAARKIILMPRLIIRDSGKLRLSSK
jgi:LacI family transcriptional regulator